ncbi:hypothetical protein OA91_23870 [Marinomonas sp. SBI8L]|uniref:hypothetical protein n=1 Tax=Marinomonas sp. SBI8L TaxID=1561205 RepID=UPI0007AF55AB|nr:hypothetical protein [Marinomonas sp. SBI8L]KZM37781.1 hypothetical protein OA91_23870 [Marinomonas sp. SBI8L]
MLKNFTFQEKNYQLLPNDVSSIDNLFTIIVGNFIGYWVFIYGLSLTLAATFALLRVGRWDDIYQTDKNK